MFKGVWASPWSDPIFKWFEKAFKTKDFWFALRNTLTLNGLDLLFGFPLPIILALLLNELAFKRYKRFTQTIVYLPHFLSWIIISGIAKQLLAPRTGVVNVLLGRAGVGPVNFLMENGLYVATYIALGLWKEMGWNTIIYLAAISGVDQQLYEAASIDGAGRLRQTFHITLPAIKGTFIVLLILRLGGLMGSNFEQIYNLYNPSVYAKIDVISTYVYRTTFDSMDFGYTTAASLVSQMINCVLLVASNIAIKKLGGRGLY